MKKEAAEVAAYLRSGDMDAETVRAAGVSLTELGVDPWVGRRRAMKVKKEAAVAGSYVWLGIRRHGSLETQTVGYHLLRPHLPLRCRMGGRVMNMCYYLLL